MSVSINDLSSALFMVRDMWSEGQIPKVALKEAIPQLLESSEGMLPALKDEISRVIKDFRASFAGAISPGHLGLQDDNALTLTSVSALALDSALSLQVLLHCAQIHGDLALLRTLKGLIDPIFAMLKAHRARLIAQAEHLRPLLLAHPAELGAQWQPLQDCLNLPLQCLWLPSEGQFLALDQALVDDETLRKSLRPSRPEKKRAALSFAHYWNHYFQPQSQSHAKAMGTVLEMAWAGPLDHQLEMELGPSTQRLRLELSASRRWQGYCLTERPQGPRQHFFFQNTPLKVKGAWQDGRYPVDSVNPSQLAQALLKQLRSWPQAVQDLLAVAAQSQVEASDVRQKLQDVNRIWRRCPPSARAAVISMLSSLINATKKGPQGKMLLRMADLAVCFQWRSQDWTRPQLIVLQDQLRLVSQ